MKASNILVPVLFIISAALVSCYEEAPVNNTGVSGPAVMEGYYFRIAGIGQDAEPVSRATYPTYVESRFDAGDRVGIFTLDEAGKALQNNLPYTVVEGENGAQALAPAGESASEGTGYRYLIYYPYSASMTLDGLRNLAYTVSDRQDNAEEDENGLTEYEKSDFLWDMASVATGADGTPKVDGDGKHFVEVVMDHVMATVVIRIRNGFDNEVPVLRSTFERTVTGGIDLTDAPTVESLRSHVYPVDGDSPLAYDNGDRTEIGMQPIELSDKDIVQSYSRAYRAAVPPQVLVKGQEIITIGGRKFKFSGGSDMKLEPGKRYTFFIKDPSRPFIDIDDDDSWIFDVVDPLTGEKVGLLCREYIRYQPDHMTDRESNMTKVDHITGFPVTDDEGNATKAISSQVWVYYDLWKFAKHKDHSREDEYMRNARNQNDLKDDDDPYLDSGIALRFINDARIFTDHAIETEAEESAAGYDPDELVSSNDNKYWPYPHVGMNSNGGIFLSKHGQMWAKSVNGDWGESTGRQHEFNMHGGKIYWGCYEWATGFKFNAVRKFVMPEKQVTTEEAYMYGHINIIRKDGKIIGTEISYDPYLSSDMNVGVLIPKYINDSRNAEEGVISYPLVKIGYNNIWSKQGLRTRYYNDGKEIECYQGADGTGIAFDFPHIFEVDGGSVFDANTGNFIKGNYPTSWWTGSFDLSKLDIPGSYAYPYSEKFDVYKYLKQERPEDENLFTKLYNFSAIVYEKNRLVPGRQSYDVRMSCYIPRIVRYYELMNYVGWLPGNKIMTNHVTTRIAGKNIYTDEELAAALKNQEFVTHGLVDQTVSAYPSNVTGLDLRAIGMLIPDSGQKQIVGGFHGGGKFGAHVAFWMDADPTYTPKSGHKYLTRKDAVAILQCNIWNAWAGSSYEQIISDFFIHADESGVADGMPFTESGMWKAYLRSRIYCAVRPVLKFNHQNGPNPHERSATSVSVARGLANMVKNSLSEQVVETPSRVTGSGNDVYVELTPVIGQ